MVESFNCNTTALIKKKQRHSSINIRFAVLIKVSLLFQAESIVKIASTIKLQNG